MGGSNSYERQINEEYEIVEVRQDGSALLKNRKNRGEFMLRNLSCNDEKEAEICMDMMKKREKVSSPHLLQLITTRKREEKNVCSMLYKLYLLIQYPFKTLKDQIDEKTPTDPFTQAELWSIVYSCSLGLETLYSNKISHESLRSKEIFISRDGFVKISDPLMLGLQKNYILLMSKKQDNIHVSPEIMNFMDDCNFAFYDKEKSDVFVLGVIILEAALLKKCQFFNKRNHRPQLDGIPQLVQQVEEKYSNSLAGLLSSMLELHPRNRPSFASIIRKVQQENITKNTEQASNSPQTQPKVKDSNSYNYTDYSKEGVFPIARTYPLQQSNQFTGKSTGNRQFLHNTPQDVSFPKQYYPVDIPISIQQQRYSLDKFGGINLGNTYKSQNYAYPSSFPSVPLFSRDIPEIMNIIQKLPSVPVQSKSYFQPQYQPINNQISQKVSAPNMEIYSFSNLPSPKPLTSNPIPRSTINNEFQQQIQSQVLDQYSVPITHQLKKSSSQTKQYQGIPGKKGNLEDHAYISKFVCFMQEDGGKYEGFMVNEQKNGKGKLSFKDGGCYVGEWTDNRMNGYGKLYYQNGALAYEGTWQDDQFNGKGTLYNDTPQSRSEPFDCSDFTTLGDQWIYYEGQFKDDCKNGHGKIKLTNEQIFDGTFMCDTIEGQGIFYSLKGQTVKGFWNDNVLKMRYS